MTDKPQFVTDGMESRRKKRRMQPDGWCHTRQSRDSIHAEAWCHTKPAAWINKKTNKCSSFYFGGPSRILTQASIFPHSVPDKWACRSSDPSGYAPCEPRGHCVSAIAVRCAHGAIFVRLAYASIDSLALDYVASGSNRTSGRRPHSWWSTSKNKKATRLGGVFAGGPSRTRTLDRPVMSREL